MLIAAVLCLCAAVAVAGAGLWLLRRPRVDDPVRGVLRSVAPTQLAASLMLAAGGLVALTAEPETALVVLIVCVIGAVGTVAAGCWQGAKLATRSTAGCGSACGSCTLACGEAVGGERVSVPADVDRMGSQ